MIPYNGEAELSMTRDELYDVHFFIDMPESLPVRPSMGTLMTYPSGMVEDVRQYFGPYLNYSYADRDPNTGEENLTYVFFKRHVVIATFCPNIVLISRL